MKFLEPRLQYNQSTHRFIYMLLGFITIIWGACSGNLIDLQSTLQEEGSSVNDTMIEDLSGEDQLSDGEMVDAQNQEGLSHQAATIVTTTLTEEDLPLVFSTTLPVDPNKFDLASAFGPRLQWGQGNRYDFHRGIDIVGSEGDAIFSVADGEIFKVYRENSTAYPGAGNIIILKHSLKSPILFHGTLVSRIYTLYFHLSSFGPAATTYLNSGQILKVAKGEKIGAMGHTGAASATHLHFEARLQTTCSLEAQVTGKTTSCSALGFDPHVNPLPLFESGTPNYTVKLIDVRSDLVTFQVSEDIDHADMNGIEVTLYSDATKTKIIETFDADFNNRTHFDATSTSALDNPDLGNLLIEPSSYTLTSLNRLYTYDYSIDPTWLQKYPNLTFEAVVINARGAVMGQVSTAVK